MKYSVGFRVYTAPNHFVDYQVEVLAPTEGEAVLRAVWRLRHSMGGSDIHPALRFVCPLLDGHENRGCHLCTFSLIDP